MLISSHENELLFSNEAQCLVDRQLRRRTKQRNRDTRSIADSSLVHSSTLIPLNFSEPLTICQNNHFCATHLFCTYCNFCTAMMTFDHDNFFSPFFKLSTSPCCTYFSSQYDGTHYNDIAQHGAWYNITKQITLPLTGKSQCIHLSTVNVRNDRPIDSAHFAQPMSHDSAYTSLSLAHICSNRLAESTRINIVSGQPNLRQYLDRLRKERFDPIHS
jgi:hypothetical protein